MNELRWVVYANEYELRPICECRTERLAVSVMSAMAYYNRPFAHNGEDYRVIEWTW